MSRDRFGNIHRFIRFDDRTGRHKNKLAPISELAEKLAANCRNLYNSNANITIDEQLVNAFLKFTFHQSPGNMELKYRSSVMQAKVFAVIFKYTQEKLEIREK